MKNPSKAYKKIVEKYLKEVKSALFCSSSMKQAFLSTVKQRISDLFPDPSALSVEELYKEIGTPEEIACSLESRSDIELLKQKAKRYEIVKIFCIICSILALIGISFLIATILSNQGYVVKTFIR